MRVGLILDIVEANQEKFYHDIVTPVPAEEPIFAQRITCPFCMETVFTELELREHISARHRDYQLYVRVNNCVVGETHELSEPIYSCVVVYAGDLATTIEVTVNGVKGARYELDTVNEVDVLADIKTMVRQVDLRAVVGQLAPYVVSVRYVPAQHGALSAVEELALSYQNAIAGLSAGEWPRFRAELQKRGNTTERTYLEGLYEYYYGFWLEKEGDKTHADKAYTNALHLLRPINRPLAQTAVRYLAFKRNYFSYLPASPRDSFFLHVYNFVCDYKYTAALGAFTLSDSKGLLIDDRDENFLRAIHAFICGRFDSALLLAQEAAHSSPDPCLVIKYKLLEARYVRESDVALARRLYRDLRDNLHFAKEAREYLDGKSAD